MVLWKGYTKIRVHQNIRKALLAIKIKQKKDYDIRIALINAENAQNNVIHTVTKYKPIEIFNISNETQYEFIKDNIKNSQININKNVEKLQVNTYVINSNIYIKKRNKLKVKYNNKIKVEIKNDLEISKNYNKLINNDNKNIQKSMHNKNINENTDSSYLDKYNKIKLEVNNKVDKNIDESLNNNKLFKKKILNLKQITIILQFKL